VLEYTFSLPRLWAAAIVICILDALLVLPIFLPGMRPFFPYLAGTSLIFFGPFLLAVWIALMALAATLHGGKSRWLLITLVPVLGGTYLFWALIGACLQGTCL
jgi:hypothetical protein